MAYEKEVAGLVNKSLHIATAGDVRDIFLAWYPHRYKNEHSAYVQAQKSCQGAVDIGWLEKSSNGRIYYKKPKLKNQHGIHSQGLTKALTTILCKFPESQIVRERLIHEIGLVPDAICLVTHKGQGRCFVLEHCRFETLPYLSSKIHKLEFWEKSTEFLSDLFHVDIPSFDLVVDGAIAVDLPKLDDYLKDLFQGGEKP